MANVDSVPPPPGLQPVSSVEGKDSTGKPLQLDVKTNPSWQDWFWRVQQKLNSAITAATAQLAIQFKDEGSSLGTAGTVTAVNFVGPDIVAARSTDTVTLTQSRPTITLSGDTSGSGTTAITTTLATVNANVGSFGSSTNVAAFTVNGKGLVTAASNVAIVFPVTSVFTQTGAIANLSGDVTTSGSSVTTLATVNATTGTFGDATHVARVTVNAKGLITAASSVLITGTAPGGAAGGDLSGTYPNPTVANINGAALGTTTATAGNLLIGSGTQWVTSAVSGDAALASSGALTLATVNTNTGSFGDSTHVTSLTVNGKGLITAASSVAIAFPVTSVFGLTGAVSNLTGDVTSSGVATTLATVNSNIGSFGDGTHVGSFTVNAKGLVTAASSVAITYPGSFSGFANPTASIGLTTVNGVATTAMRSDAAPALSQAITPIWTGSHTFNKNTASLPTATTGTLIQLGNADSTVTAIELDSFASQSEIIAQRANGTCASPTAIANNDILFLLGCRGYGATAYSSNAVGQAQIRFNAAQAWTDAAQGTYITMLVTATGAITRTTAFRLDSNGINATNIGATTPGSGDFTAISTTGAATIGASSTINAGATSGGGLAISGSNSPKIKVTSTGGSVTSGLFADDAQGYVGTDTNHKFSLRVNGGAVWDILTNGAFSQVAAGSAFKIKEGSNASMGTATLVGGTVTVSNTLVTANTRIFTSVDNPGIVANLGSVYEDSTVRSAGTSFTIKSTNALSTATVSWLLIEPA